MPADRRPKRTYERRELPLARSPPPRRSASTLVSTAVDALTSSEPNAPTTPQRGLVLASSSTSTCPTTPPELSGQERDAALNASRYGRITECKIEIGGHSFNVPRDYVSFFFWTKLRLKRAQEADENGTANARDRAILQECPQTNAVTTVKKGHAPDGSGGAGGPGVKDWNGLKKDGSARHTAHGHLYG